MGQHAELSSATEANFANFELRHRYVPGRLVGRGSCGLVFSAVNKETDAKVAIKKISLRDETSAKRTLREIQFQSVFRHSNVLGITDLCFAAEDRSLFCVLPRMDTDLSKVIRSQQALSLLHVQYFTEQLLDGLAYLHECCNVMHRDLKPANLLVNETCELRISDFGLARLDPGLDATPDAPSPPSSPGSPTDDERLSDRLTTYVVTRWYRAPELVLSSRRYSKAVDLWSVGCIVAELIGRKPLFPGSSHVDQLERIIEQLGTPEHDSLQIVPDGAKRYIAGLPPRAPKPLASRFPDATPALISLLEILLVWDPARRATVREALNHPYLGAVPDPGCAGCVRLEDALRHDGVREDPFGALQREVARFRAEHTHADVPRGSSPPLATPTGAASPQQSATGTQAMERCDAPATCEPPALPTSAGVNYGANYGTRATARPQQRVAANSYRSSPTGVACGAAGESAAEAAKREATAFAKLLGERAEAESRHTRRASRSAFESGFAVPTRA